MKNLVKNIRIGDKISIGYGKMIVSKIEKRMLKTGCESIVLTGAWIQNNNNFKCEQSFEKRSKSKINIL